MKSENKIDGLTLSKCKSCKEEKHTSEGLCSECFDKKENKYSEDELLMYGNGC